MKKALAAALAAFAMAGCAGGPPAFPDTRDTVVRVVSAATPDLMGIYAIPGSQVEVSGTNASSGIAAGVGAVLFGGVGALSAGQIADRIHNRAAVIDHEAALVVRFDQLIADRLRAARVGAASSDSPSRVTLIPRARLHRSGKDAILICTLEASYSVGGMVAPYVHRAYSYTAPQTRPIAGSGDGWSDNNGKLLRAIAEPAFAALADTFAADWHGRLARGSGQAVRVQRGAMKEPRTFVKVHEVGDYVVLGTGTAESPRTSSLVLVERAAIVPDGS